MRWTEAGAGTNAIGSALAIDHAVQAFSGEHFLSEQHAWWCPSSACATPRSSPCGSPGGLTGEELTLHLYGDTATRVSTNGEMSRLRRLLGPCAAGRPHRLIADVTADFVTFQERLAPGDLDGALAAYRGPHCPHPTDPAGS